MRKALPLLLAISSFLFLQGCGRKVTAPTTPFVPAPSQYFFQTQWGDSAPLAGTGQGEFSHPHGVAVDGSGNVYVADTDNHRILKLNASGQYLSQWGSLGTGPGDLSSPYGVAVDGEGNVYVTETGNNRVQKFTSNGVFLTQWGDSAPVSGSGANDFNRPQGVVAAGGNVFVADTGNHRIQKLNPAGGFLKNWGSLGSAGDQFDYPGWVSVDSRNNLYVSDTYNYRIEKYDTNGNLIGTLADCPGLPVVDVCWWCFTSGPLGSVVEPNGNILVSDGGNGRLQEFGKDGSHLGVMTMTGPATNQFADNSGLALDGLGNLYVADTTNNRIVVLKIK